MPESGHGGYDQTVNCTKTTVVSEF